MKSQEARTKLVNDPDFVYLKRFDFSLEKLMERYPEGVPDNRIIADALMITEDDVEDIYQHVVEKLRRTMKVE